MFTILLFRTWWGQFEISLRCWMPGFVGLCFRGFRMQLRNFLFLFPVDGLISVKLAWLKLNLTKGLVL